jgi:hypothetical protein
VAAAEASDSDKIVKDVEPDLIYNLIQMRTRQPKYRDQITNRLNKMVANNRTVLLSPLEAVAWVKFEKQTYTSGINALRDLVAKAPMPPKPSGDGSLDSLKQMFQWIGQMRQFADTAVKPEQRPADSTLAALDEAAAKHGPELLQAYKDGRDKSTAVYRSFERQKNAEGADVDRLTVEQRQLNRYAEFPYEQALTHILAGMDY